MAGSLSTVNQDAYQLVGVPQEDWLHGRSRDEGPYEQDEILVQRLCVSTGFTTEKNISQE